MSLRQREMGGFTPSSCTWRWWNTGQNPVPPWLSATFAERGFYKETVDVVTPNFSKLQAEGRIINNPMWSSEVESSGGDSGWKFQNVQKGTTYYGECQGDWGLSSYKKPANPGLDGAIIDRLKSTTATAAWAGVDVGEFQGLAALGELHQTLNLLGDPVRELQKFLWQKAWASADWNRARGRAEKAKALGRLISSLWLQYQYAFRPLIMDLEAILKELHEQSFSIRRTSRSTAKESKSYTTQYVGRNAGIEVDFTETVNQTYTVRSGVLYEGAIDPLKQFGLHWTNLPSAAWELVPWSFVADWFINVGDYLQSITPKVGVRILAGFTSVKVETTVIRKSGAARLPVAGWVTLRSPNGTDVANYRNYSRTPSIGSPELAYTPVIQAMLKGNRGLNAYMLFLQQFLGYKPKIN